MDMRDPTRSKHNGSSKAGEEDPQVVPVGTLRRFLSKIKAPQQIKQEPEEGQCWDTRRQGSLKTVYSPQAGEEEPQNSKVKLEEDGRGFQASFKAVVDTSGCPTREPAAQTLLGHLRVTQEASEGLDLSLKVKEEVLDEEALGLEAWRQRFRHFSYQEAEGPREALRQLQRLCYQWLEPERRTKEQILEVVILEQFLDVLPLEMQSWVKEQGPETCAKAVAQAEDFLVRLKEMKEPFQTVIVKSPESGQEPLDAMTRQSDELARLLGHVEVKIKGEDLCSQRPERLLLNESSLGETKENDLLHSDSGERLLNQQGLETLHRNAPGQVAETALLCLGESDSSLHESAVNGGILERRRKNVCAECENLGWNFSFTFPKNQKMQREKGIDSCGQCGKILKRGASHVTQKQAVSGEKPYQCLECGKSFGWKSSLTSHKRTHTGDKPYRCTECGKSFTISSQLIRHKRIHADLWVTLAAQKKRKIDAECRVFNEKWTLDYFFVEVKCMPVCLICGEALSIMKKANLQRHYRTKHLQYEDYQGQLREEKVKALKNDFDVQQGLSTQPRRDMNSVEQASHVVSELIARKLRRHSEGEIVKECLVATAALLAPEKLKLFESVSFSRKMVPH